MKDPRKKLTFWLKLSIISLILIPFLYFNLKNREIIKIILFFIIWIIAFFILKKFDKKDKEYKLHETIGVCYMFAGFCIFFALAFIFVLFYDYLKLGALPSITSLFVISVLLLFGITLFYFSYKSTCYEKKLGYRTLNLLRILSLGSLAIILLITGISLIITFLGIIFEGIISANLIIINIILIIISTGLFLYVKRLKIKKK